MLYRPDIDEVVERYRRYWASAMPREILVRTTLAGEKVTDAWEAWPSIEDTVDRFEAYFAQRTEIRDDTVPVALPGLGFGIFGAVFGAPMTLQSFNSSSEPYGSLREVCSLRFDPENEWVKKQLGAVEYFLERARGKFAVAPFETISGINALYALRGPEVFADMLEDPESCHKAMEMIRQAGI